MKVKNLKGTINVTQEKESKLKKKTKRKEEKSKNWKEVSIEYYSSNDMIADYHTKPLIEKEYAEQDHEHCLNNSSVLK